LARLRRTTQFDAIAVYKGQKARGFLCKTTQQKSRDYNVVPFTDIEAGMACASRDNFFRLDELLIWRKKGWPMGGSFSEPATLVDLGEDVFWLYNSKKKASDSGWKLKGLDMQQTVQGLLHVDDCLLLSEIHCPVCLEMGTKNVWPKDVGTSLEEKGPVIVFLSARITFGPGKQFKLEPNFANFQYALGREDYPHLSRLGPFLGHRQHTFEHLRRYVWAKMLSFNHLIRGNAEDGCAAFCFLALEIIRLHWPPEMLASCILGLPRRHESTFTLVAKRVAHQIQRERVRLKKLGDKNSTPTPDYLEDEFLWLERKYRRSQLCLVVVTTQMATA
jgi:hypothetical protein